MSKFVIRRIGSSLITLLIIAVVSFFLVHMTPGDPVAAALGGEATQEQIDAVRADLGLDDPLFVQFARWSSRVFGKLDLGQSLQLQTPVVQLIASRAEPTLLFAGSSFLIMILFGIPAGVTAAVHHSKPRDQITMVLATIGMSIPTFMLGILLILTFAVYVQWFPVAGYVSLFQAPVDSFRHVFLPSVTLGLSEAALVARMTRTSVLAVLNEDYVRTARAKGQTNRIVLYHHVLRNAAIPILTVVGLTIARLLGGSIILEEVFGLPGIGRMVVTALRRRDYPIIQAAILLTGLVYMTVNLAVDLAYAWFDPRVRYD